MHFKKTCTPLIKLKVLFNQKHMVESTLFHVIFWLEATQYKPFVLFLVMVVIVEACSVVKEFFFKKGGGGWGVELTYMVSKVL